MKIVLDKYGVQQFEEVAIPIATCYHCKKQQARYQYYPLLKRWGILERDFRYGPMNLCGRECLLEYWHTPTTRGLLS